MKTEREIDIDGYIAQHPDANLQHPDPVYFHGKVNNLTTYRLPIKLLIFNIGNGRFAAELLAEEKKLGRKLDVLNNEDSKIIQRLLLEQDAGETKHLKESLRKDGQIHAGIITFDGAVINANRRMATLMQLHEETQDDRFEYLKVARLPRGVDAKDLWKLEASLQFGREFRLEYGAVNELLKIRSGKLSGLSEKQISDAIDGRYTEKGVKDKLETLKLMDSYLNTIGKPGNYTLIQEERRVQGFVSLHENAITPLKKGAHRSEVTKIIEVGFAMIKNGMSHWDVRDLRKIAELDAARTQLYRAYSKDGKLSSEGEEIRDAYDSAMDVVNMHDQKNRPERLAEKALTALKQIDAAHESVKAESFKTMIAEIQKEVERLAKPLSKRTKRR
jgi:hypothetical protein